MANIIQIVITAKDQASSKIKSMGSKIKGSVEKLITLPHIVAGAAVVGVVGKMIKAYGVQEEAIAKLNAALISLGIQNDGVTKAITDQAAALQEVTKFGDEQIIAVQTMLLQMGVLPSELERATISTLNWATAMGKDAVSASLDIGKAAGGNLMMLQRYGIQVDRATFETDGFTAVLDVLEDKFGGQAEAVAKKGTGPLKQFQNTVGDAGEKIAESLLPGINSMIESFKEILPVILPIIQSMSAVFATLLTGIANVFKIVQAVMQGRFKDIVGIARNSEKQITQIWKDLSKNLIAAENETTVNLKDIKVKQREQSSTEKQKEMDEQVEAEQGRIAAQKSLMEEELNLRRQLRDLDFEDMLEFLDNQINALEEGSEARIALEQIAAEQRQALSIEEAQSIFAIRDKVASKWSSTLEDVLKGEKSFTEASKQLWNDLGNVIIQMLAKTIAEEAAGAIVTIAIEKAKAQAKAISAHAGIPFVGLALGVAAAGAIVGSISRVAKFQRGGIATGPTPGIFGEAGDEALIPLDNPAAVKKLQEAGFGGGGGVAIGSIVIQFPNVTSFADWMAADPDQIKEVTERKLFQAFRDLASEGRMEDIVT